MCQFVCFIQFSFQASGGSGNYSWVSANPNVAAVNVKGEISTNQIGDSVVTAADVRNTAHTASMIVRTFQSPVKCINIRPKKSCLFPVTLP